MIAALGVPIFNRPDLLARCLRSVDFPVETLIVVNNGSLPWLSRMVFHETERNPHLSRAVVFEPGANLGVAGGWNLIMDAAMNIMAFGIPSRVNGMFPLGCADSVLICGNDIEWMPGDLALFDKALADFPEADFLFGNHSYSNFLVKRSGLEKCGAFDENFYEAYGEDGDAWQKIRRTGAKAIHVAGLRAAHEGSATINADIGFKARVQKNQARSQGYYGRKWGCAPFSHASETYETPFNEGGDVTAWKLSDDRMTQPHYLSQWPQP